MTVRVCKQATDLDQSSQTAGAIAKRTLSFFWSRTLKDRTGAMVAGLGATWMGKLRVKAA